jgi:hypothetical protein
MLMRWLVFRQKKVDRSACWPIRYAPPAGSADSSGEAEPDRIPGPVENRKEIKTEVNPEGGAG